MTQHTSTPIERTTPPDLAAGASFAEAQAAVNRALAAIRAGDPEPYIRCWADSEDVTLFGAWGPVEKGHRRLEETFRWVGSRFTSGSLHVEDTVAFESSDLAYTVGFEYGEAAVDARSSQSMPIRVTHVYRRMGGEWRLVHRHADFPPTDPRPTSA